MFDSAKINFLASSGNHAIEILCSVCGNYRKAMPISNGAVRVKFKNINSLSSAIQWRQSICRECEGFWSRKAYSGKYKGSFSSWQEKEHQVNNFFLKRRIPSTLSSGRGPDVTISLFGYTFYIEVKSALLKGKTVYLRSVTKKRKIDDIVVAVLDDGRFFWFPMQEFVSHQFSEKSTRIPSEVFFDERLRSAERSFLTIAKNKGLNLEIFSFLPPLNEEAL